MSLNKALIALFLTSQALYATASEQSDCQAAAGSFITGTIAQMAKYYRRDPAGYSAAE